jgi:hypothetical protein
MISYFVLNRVGQPIPFLVKIVLYNNNNNNLFLGVDTQMLATHINAAYKGQTASN